MIHPIEHVFVLMLENRSFDHMFGFSGLSGVDAATGAHTAIDGLVGADSGDEFPMVSSLKGIGLLDVHRVDRLVADLKASQFSYSYTFIEPSYNILHDYRQHPLADVRDGEALIKTVYEAIRNSSVWERSVLIITWDEHGGFYDHVAPPPAVVPGDTQPRSKHNQYGFTFGQYGVRVPALVISPLCPEGHHRPPHVRSCVDNTIERIFGLRAMTARDAAARDVLSLLSLPAVRAADCPTTLPTPASPPALAAMLTPSPVDDIGTASRPTDSINAGMLPTVIHSAMRQDILMRPSSKASILAQVAGLQTREDAMGCLAEVQKRLKGRTQQVS